MTKTKAHRNNSCIWLVPGAGSNKSNPKCLYKPSQARKIEKCPAKCSNYKPRITKFRNTETKYLVENVLGTLFNSMMQYESSVSCHNKNLDRRRRKDPNRNNQYHFIPALARSLILLLESVFCLARKKADMPFRPKFLDCGAGVGNVMLLASIIGFDAHGIEYDRNTVRRGRALIRRFGMPRLAKQLFRGDLLTFDQFHKYDVLYFYCPMKKTKQEGEFERRLTENMREGAIMIGGMPRIARGSKALFQKVDITLKDQSWQAFSAYIKVR